MPPEYHLKNKVAGITERNKNRKETNCKLLYLKTTLFNPVSSLRLIVPHLLFGGAYGALTRQQEDVALLTSR